MNAGLGASGAGREDEDLFRSYRLPLRAFFARRLDSLEEVDDHVQEVFCRLCTLEEGKRPENPRPTCSRSRPTCCATGRAGR